MSANDWFELAEQRTRQRELEEASRNSDSNNKTKEDHDEREEGQEPPLRVLEDDETKKSSASRALPPRGKSVANKRNKRSWKATTVVIVGIAILGGVIAAALSALLHSEDKPTVAPAAQALSTASESSPQTTVGFAGHCSSVEGKTPVPANTKNLRGAVVAFETAYYRGDPTAVVASVDDQSALATTDWKKVLAEAAPEGTTWCAIIQPDKGDVVDVDLTVTQPSGEQKTFPQTITGVKQAGDTWVVKKIEPRK